MNKLLILSIGLLAVAFGFEASAGETPAGNPQLVWDPATLTCIQPGGTYARMVQLTDHSLVCVYDDGRKIQARRSLDLGRTWRDPVLAAESPYGRTTNAELLPLHDGSLLCFLDLRPDSAFGDEIDGRWQLKKGVAPHPFEIAFTRSGDGGETWSPSATIYSAGPEYDNGCWEPSAVETPAGEIQVFFANEGPYRDSDEQEITLLRSRDGAQTWSTPETASFRAGHRDGMPVPLVLANNKGSVFAIEDSGFGGGFKPAIIYSDVSDNWHAGSVPGGSPRRWPALGDALPKSAYGGAPYIRQLASGPTVLSFQENDAGVLAGSRFVVCVGDAQARNFGALTQPFPHEPGTTQLWGSLAIKNGETVTAVCDAQIHGVAGIWSIDGHLAPASQQTQAGQDASARLQ